MTPLEPFALCASGASPWSFGRVRGRPAPCLQLDPKVPPVFCIRSEATSIVEPDRISRTLGSCGQFLVGDAAATSSGDQIVQPLERMALHIPFVQSEGEL